MGNHIPPSGTECNIIETCLNLLQTDLFTIIYNTTTQISPFTLLLSLIGYWTLYKGNKKKWNTSLCKNQCTIWIQCHQQKLTFTVQTTHHNINKHPFPKTPSAKPLPTETERPKTPESQIAAPDMHQKLTMYLRKGNPWHSTLYCLRPTWWWIMYVPCIQ